MWLLAKEEEPETKGVVSPLWAQTTAQLRQKCRVFPDAWPFRAAGDGRALARWYWDEAARACLGSSWPRMTWAQKDLEICCLAFVSCFQALGPGAGECFQAHLPAGQGELGKKVWLTLTSHVAGQSQVQTLAQNNFVCISLWFPCKHTHLLICDAPLKKNNVFKWA